ncbi:MAG TPA: 4-alpha-glucanotransferase [Pirellulaceae bacterium]|nr:4-alpha-glucanotransferase [Pirellulaceae bacterium]
MNQQDVRLRPANSWRKDAKRLLGVDRLVLQIHDASFPSDPDEDLGRGSPYTRGAERFLVWAAGLGFDAIQFGPRGMTSRGNPSPYDATIFSRNPLDLPLLKLVEQGRVSRVTWESIRRSFPPATDGVVPYPLVFAAYEQALAEIAATADRSDRIAAREFLAANVAWLAPDALYGQLSREHGSHSWLQWSRTPRGALDQGLLDPPPGCERSAAKRLAELRHQHARVIENYALIQWLLVEEHRQLRERMARVGLLLFGDLQVGLSFQDTWARQRAFLRGYRMGAPPSRTNPQGQPWGYAVLDPAQFGTAEEPGPALAFVRARIARVLAECDGLRIDHPHGWIDPWVYRSEDPDPLHAVQTGARLFSSPNDPQHPALAKLAIARPDQIDHAELHYADGRVKDLDDDQVRRYSILVDEIVTQQAAAGRAKAIACEVLSTLPYPVGRVMERHDLGRFRVTQKLDLGNPADVYRLENALPHDWIMLGTHDTPPIWQLAEQWQGGERAAGFGRYLAELLAAPAEREALAAQIAGNSGRLVNSLFAAMLASRARNIVVFFPDLFGLTVRYNEPGVVSDANWSLRVPADFEAFYDRQRQRGRALDLDACEELATNK